jgi:hypothetical protein
MASGNKKEREHATHHQVTVPLVEYAPHGLFLREPMMTGVIDGKRFELCKNVNGSCLVLVVAGRQFVLGSQEFIQAVYGQLVDVVKQEDA